MKTKILAALTQYDPDNSEHWTTDGMPKMHVMQEAVPDLANVTRRQVTEAAPDFNREYAHSLRKAPEPVPTQVAPQAPAVVVETAPVLVGDPSEPQAKEAPSKDQLERMKDEMDGLDVQIAGVSAHMEQIKVARDKLLKERDNIAQALDEAPLVSFHDAVKIHQASQLALRAERAAGAKRLQSLAKSVDAVAPGSKGSRLDQSMARKNTRGAARPQWPGRTIPPYPKRG